MNRRAKVLRQRLSIVIVILGFVGSNLTAYAEFANQQQLYQENINYFDVNSCGGATAGTNTSSAGSSDTTCCAGGADAVGAGDTLDGHTLPAGTGGTGDEDPVDSSGHLTTTGGAVTFSQFASKGQAYQDYYITMRWEYAKWNWDGTSTTGPEDSSWYSSTPRKVLVTNPRNNKSIIADIMESGPAPWTGTSEGQGNKPSYWNDPQLGTPAQYKGRVSGFPPVAIRALGAIQTVSGQGDKLVYAWAADQNAQPGPTNQSAGSGGSGPTSTGSGGCSNGAGDGSNASIVQVAQQELALHLVGTGPLQDSGPVCKYQGSVCGEEWCADFVSWVYKTAGKPFTGGVDGGWRLSSSSDTTGYFLSRKDQPGTGYGTPSSGDKVEPGWVVSFKGVQTGPRGIGHVGIVESVNADGTFNDIEGNGSGPGVSERKNLALTSAIDWGGYK